jgi:hypothetical protein
MFVFKKYDRQNHVQSQLQLVNLHRNRRYFVIKLHTWFCLSYFLKTNIKCYCSYQYFMSVNSFFNTTVSRNRYGVEKNCWYSKNIDKCNKTLCLSSRNMIDKTMCEVLWRKVINILWVSTVFSTPYLFLDTAARLQWPVTQISRSQQFFLNTVV